MGGDPPGSHPTSCLLVLFESSLAASRTGVWERRRGPDSPEAAKTQGAQGWAARADGIRSDEVNPN